MRALVYFCCTPLLLTFYGWEVCPFIDTLTPAVWMPTLTAAFALVYLAYLGPGRARLAAKPFDEQPKSEAFLVISLFLLAGSAVTGFNTIRHVFPVGSGLKIVLGCAIIGLFAASDLALARSRLVALRLKESGQELIPERGFHSLPKRLAVFAMAGTLSMAGILLLLIFKDMQWLVAAGAGDLRQASRSILIETGFVVAVLLGLSLNLLFSYSRNLRHQFQQQTAVLSAVSAGRLEGRVPVTTRDEFGLIAKHTNAMIEGLRERTRELHLTQDVTIVALAGLAETRDNETGEHILRTQCYVRVLAEQLQGDERFRPALDPAAIELMFKSAPLHDVGKVGIPDRILLKPGRLTADEFEIMKTHATLGAECLALAEKRLGTSSFLHLAREIALTHHEKWDGSGYPQGLAGEAIPLSGRLMALADVYDALISKRVYKPAFSHQQAREIILQGRGSHFDPAVVDAFLRKEEEFVRIARELADREAGPAAVNSAGMN